MDATARVYRGAWRGGVVAPVVRSTVGNAGWSSFSIQLNSVDPWKKERS